MESLLLCQAITWTSAGLLSIWPLATNLSEIWIETQNFSFMKMHLKMLFEKWLPFCPGEMSTDDFVSSMVQDVSLHQGLLM